MKHSEQTKQKISQSLKGHFVSDETRRKLSEYHKKFPVNYWLGKYRSEETKKKIGNANKGKIVTQETRNKISKAQKGKVISKKHKKILSERMKTNNPSFGGLSNIQKKKISKNNVKYWKGKKRTQKTKELIKRNTIKTLKKSEVRLKMREARAKQKFPFCNTSIEIKMQKALEKQGINFQTQKYELIGTPDIFIEPNICIFCDGDYWHNLPKAKIRDRYVNEELKKQNYKILRFWEHKINKNVESCVDKISIIVNNL